MKLVPLVMAAMAVLGVMIAISLTTGVSQETFEIVREARMYSADLVEHATPLRALFALDSAFLILYTFALVMFAQRLVTADTRLVLSIAIGAILATAVLDMVEDHFILAMLRGAERGTDAGAGQIAFQHTVSQVKFHLSYLAQFGIGLCVPRRTFAGKLLGWLLTAGTLVQGAWLYVAPDALLPAGNLGRWIGFLVGFALVIQVVRRPGAGAGATDALA